MKVYATRYLSGKEAQLLLSFEEFNRLANLKDDEILPWFKKLLYGKEMLIVEQETEMKNPPNRAILSEGNNTLKESKDEKESGPGK